MKPASLGVLAGLVVCMNGCFDPQGGGDSGGSTGGTSTGTSTSPGTTGTSPSTTQPPPSGTSSSTDPATSTGVEETSSTTTQGDTTAATTTTGGDTDALCDLSGDALPMCKADFGGVVSTGTLPCDGTMDTSVFFADIYELELEAKDCVSLFADNIGPAGPTGSPGPDLLMQVRAEDGTFLQFDDEMPCTDPVWTGDFACPRGGFTAPEAGTYIVAVVQYGGPGCPNGGPYTLSATINGVTPPMTGPDVDDHELDCG